MMPDRTQSQGARSRWASSLQWAHNHWPIIELKIIVERRFLLYLNYFFPNTTEGQLGLMFWLHSIDQIEKWSNFILPINLHVINIQIEAIFPFRTISSTYHGIQKSISFYFKQFLYVLQKHMVFQTFRSMEKETISKIHLHF